MHNFITLLGLWKAEVEGQRGHLSKVCMQRMIGCSTEKETLSGAQKWRRLEIFLNGAKVVAPEAIKIAKTSEQVLQTLFLYDQI